MDIAIILSFANESPWLFFAVVLVLSHYLYRLTYCVFWLLPNRILSTVKVLIKGWPPAHIDADGDWKPLPKPKAGDKHVQM